ncbi:HAD-IA family hydrolase [Jannaschia sp. Os4]|uniref:HAD-IA family hydrolase n=1 Tax=Jannaschia sp. Os4 TaxID=2807617 RepID=UPI00193A5821|nr:HAD-IA family hydrolase [Jannaschia sp. Os4]MBM2577101.1 HAD-IA family hydrolase [Jannaschia sp. Os4]
MTALVLLDVDGTLQDSQAVIVETVRVAFAESDMTPPLRETILRTVGLSLPRMIEALAPGASDERMTALVASYRLAFAKSVAEAQPPLFAGVAEGLDRMEAAGLALGLATGKSGRGVRAFLADQGWERRFATAQHADLNPSKPHPSMIRNALAEADAPAARCVMVGDTAFDMEMARAAGVGAIGVSYGYHDAETLRRAGADAVADSFLGAVDAVLERLA